MSFCRSKKGAHTENSRVVFCRNNQRSFKPLFCVFRLFMESRLLANAARFRGKVDSVKSGDRRKPPGDRWSRVPVRGVFPARQSRSNFTQHGIIPEFISRAAAPATAVLIHFKPSNNTRNTFHQSGSEAKTAADFSPLFYYVERIKMSTRKQARQFAT